MRANNRLGAARVPAMTFASLHAGAEVFARHPRPSGA
jgi:hypothetical protein